MRGLTWTVGSTRIVDDVTFDVADGEFVAVIGPNGAGKTSLFNLISGLIRPTAGSVTLDGVDLTAAPPHRRARLGLGRTFQSSSVFPALTVRENVRIAAARRGGWLGVGGGGASADRAASSAAEAALDDVGLSSHAADLAGTLSHGDKRKLELAVLLATEPRIMLLDEPMAGVATGDVPALTELIREIHRAGRPVLMVEHHMEVLLGLADRVAVMHHGALLAIDTPARVMDDETVQHAYVGEPL
ncbi:ABC transporter ATP-binding protein [Virgisporangium aurantiacum]